MKKTLITLVFSIAVVAAIQAQKVDMNSLKLGIQASPTFSWMSTNDNQITSNGVNLGLNLGLMAEYYFSENYSLVTGASLMLNQGGGLNYAYDGNFLPKAAEDRAMTTTAGATQLDSISSGSTIRFKGQYIEIPFSIRLRTNEFGYFRYYAELPIFALGFRTQGRANISGGSPATTNENITADINPISFKWGLGGGIEYSVSPNLSLIGGLFYTSTLLDVTRDNGTQIFGTTSEEDSKGTIQSLTIRIGAIF